MSTSVAAQQTELLTSWKEIASYLGKGVRTVQRWEQQFGLPVRRPNERIKGIVRATRQELDEWLNTQWSQRPKELAQADGPAFYIDEVRASIRQSAELRHANRLLIEDVRHTVRSMFRECETMARNLSGIHGAAPPSADKLE